MRLDYVVKVDTIIVNTIGRVVSALNKKELFGHFELHISLSTL